MKNSASMIGALFLGMAVGAIVGVLFAPDKGSETRKRIAGGAKDAANNFKDKIKWRKKGTNGEPEDYLEEYYRNIGLSVGHTRGFA